MSQNKTNQEDNVQNGENVENDRKEDSNRHDPIKTTKTYGKTRARAVQIVYLCSMAFWVFLIIVLQLYKTQFFGFIILLIPFFFYFIGYWNADKLTVEVEDKTFAVSYISISLLIVIPLVTWVEKNFYGNRWYITKIIVVAVVLALISLIDIWVRPKWITLVRHIKSALQTASLTLLVFALYAYYMGQHLQVPSFGT